MSERTFWGVMTGMLIVGVSASVFFAASEVLRGHIVSAFLMAMVGAGLAAALDTMFKNPPPAKGER